MTCLELANPTIQEIIYCSVQLGVGDYVFVGVLLFALTLYGLYKFRTPFVAAVPIGILIVFAFAGAGSAENKVVGLPVFESMLLTVLVLGAIAIVLLLWRFSKQ